jgi:hypothetical protein
LLWPPEMPPINSEVAMVDCLAKVHIPDRTGLLCSKFYKSRDSKLSSKFPGQYAVQFWWASL